MELDWETILKELAPVIRAAGARVVEIYEQEKYQIEIKPDRSPVTEADKISHQMILEGLTRITPHIPVISEEGAQFEAQIRQTWKQFWLVDPLDGTKEFIHRTGEFTLNVALIDSNYPVIGMVYAPIKDELYWASLGGGAYCQQGSNEPYSMRAGLPESKKLRIAVSRRHDSNPVMEQFLGTLGLHEVILCGSAMKICWVADNRADVYPRLRPTSEWDTAAGQCILEAVGGHLLTCDGKRLEYNKPQGLLNPPFVAFRHADFLKRVSLETLRSILNGR